LTVTTDVAGWTVVTPSADSRIVYVSNSALGNDTNNGLSALTPVKTLGKAYSLLRSGYPDQMLLKRGESFYGQLADPALPDSDEWRKSGRSASEPMVIGAYGIGDRPKIRTGVEFGLTTYNKSDGTRSVNNLFIMSLDLFPETFNHDNGTQNTDGIRLYAQGENYLIEDCKISGYQENIVLGATQAGLRNVTIRRNVITNAHAFSTNNTADPNYSKSLNSHGLYIGGLSTGVVAEENIFDHNGWRDGVETDRDTAKNHNVYVYAGTNVTVRNNVITRGGYYGIKMNAGGTVTNNFFAKSPEFVYLENPALIDNNVMTEPSSIPTLNRGIGINTYNASNATISGNLITRANNTNASGIAGIQLAHSTSVVSSATVENNIVYDWRNGLLVNTKGNGNASVVIRNNQFQMLENGTAAGRHDSTGPIANFAYSGNVYRSGTSTTSNKWMGSSVSLNTWKTNTGETTAEYRTISYPDPGRSIGGYATVAGSGSTFESYIAAAMLMDKSTWNQALLAPAVNNWFRAGFGMSLPGVPTVSGAVFSNQRLPISVDLTFTTDIGVAPAPTALTLLNQTTGQLAVPSSVTYSSSTRTAKFLYNAALADGSYLASFGAGFAFSFKSLSADATGDGRVGTGDFNALSGNFGGTNKTFSQGDFNYDGNVNSADFTIFQANYGRVITTPAPLIIAPTSSPFGPVPIASDEGPLDFPV